MQQGIMQLGESLVAGGPALIDEYFVMSLLITTDGKLHVRDPQGTIMWSAPVGDVRVSSATLTKDGSFAAYSGVFEDRAEIWSTGTDGRNVTKLQLSVEEGLRLFDSEGKVVWQSPW